MAALACSAAPALALPDWSVVGAQPNDGFASALALGDADGDGYDDLLVGAPARSDGAGYLALFDGGPDGIDAAGEPRWELLGDRAGAYLGTTITALGDVIGDGRADFAAGAPDYTDSTQPRRGRVYVFRGAPHPTWLVQTATWDGTASHERFGATLVGPGDVDGDGFADVLVGSPDALGGAGRVALYVRDPDSALPVFVASRVLTGAPGQRLGATLAKVWDVDGDGRADTLIGDAGGTHLYSGASFAGGDDVFGVALEAGYGGIGDVDGDGLADLRAASDLTTGLTTDLAPSPAGDVDGDGVPDAWFPTGDPSKPVVILSGRGHIIRELACVACPSDAAIVVAAGDVDGDGYADLAVGVPGFIYNEQPVGVVHIWRGGPGARKVDVRTSWSATGGPMGIAGDRDDDGFGDLVVGGDDDSLTIRHGGRAALGPPVSIDVPGFAHATGDLDGDGKSDLVIAAPDGVRVVGLRANPTWRFAAEGDVGPARWLATGDFDGDGYVDLVVGAILQGRPSVAAFLGGASGLGAQPAWHHAGGPLTGGAPRLIALGHVDGPLPADLAALDDAGRFATLNIRTAAALEVPLQGPGGVLSVAPAGDIDGDGLNDVIITYADRIAVHRGGDAGLDLAPSWTWQRARGWGGGDLDGDGLADLVIDDDEGPRVAWGPLDGSREALQLMMHVVDITPAGDTDGDGASELLVDDGDTVRLVAFTHAGRGSAPRTREVDGTRTLGRDVASTRRGAFAVDALPSLPFGGAAAGIELQVAPAGAPLADGARFETPAAPLVVGGRVSAAATGLLDGTPYRYRVRTRLPLSIAPVHTTTPWVHGGAIDGPLRGAAVTRPLAPPVARDDAFTGHQWSGITRARPGVLANDTGLPGEALSVSVVQPPRHGSLDLATDGAFGYRATSGQWGDDSFRYRAHGDGGVSEAEVSLTIRPVGVCYGYEAAGCRAGRVEVTVLRSDGSLAGVRCWRDGDTLRCDADDSGLLRLGPPACERPRP